MFPGPVHEPGPTLEHDDDLKVRLVSVPSGALFWCHVGFDQVCNHFSVRGVGNAQVAVEEKVAQSFGFERGVAGFDVRKQCGVSIKHEKTSVGEMTAQNACFAGAVSCAFSTMHKVFLRCPRAGGTYGTRG